MNPIPLDGDRLTLEQLFSIALDQTPAEILPATRERMNASRAVIEKLIASESPSPTA